MTIEPTNTVVHAMLMNCESLDDLERMAYEQGNALALLCLEVSEGEGIDPDDYGRLEAEVDELQDRLYDAHREIDDLARENIRIKDDLNEMEDAFQKSQDELATVMAELEELKLGEKS